MDPIHGTSTTTLHQKAKLPHEGCLGMLRILALVLWAQSQWPFKIFLACYVFPFDLDHQPLNNSFAQIGHMTIFKIIETTRISKALNSLSLGSKTSLRHVMLKLTIDKPCFT